MEDVDSKLVDLDRAGREGDIVSRTAVGEWQEWGQFSRRGLSGLIRGDCRLLGCGEHLAVLQDALVLTQTFVTAVEEGVAPPYRATYGAAEVVALQRGLIACVANQGKSSGGVHGAIEVVASIEGLVAEVIEGLAMELVAAGAGRDGDDGAVAATVLRTEGGVIDLELGGGADRRLKGDLILAYIVEIDAVDLEVYRVFAIAGGNEGVGAEAAAGSGKAARCVRHDASRGQHSEIEKVTAVQWKFLHRLTVDHLPDRNGRSFDLGDRALYLDRRSSRGE